MILTSTAKIKSKKCVLVSVKTTLDIEHGKIPEAMAMINALELHAPIKLGDVLIKDFLFEGNNLVATRTISE